MKTLIAQPIAPLQLPLFDLATLLADVDPFAEEWSQEDEARFQADRKAADAQREADRAAWLALPQAERDRIDTENYLASAQDEPIDFDTYPEWRIARAQDRAAAAAERAYYDRICGNIEDRELVSEVPDSGHRFARYKKSRRQ